MTTQLAPRAFNLAALALGFVLLLGVSFRIYHVDHKVYWVDETYTSIHLAGLTEDELVGRAASFQNIADLQHALHPSRSERRPISYTVQSLIREDPQHPPLYYVVGYFWTLVFGTSITAVRSLSVVVGIVALPLMYWLCAELFRSRLAAWMGTALIAASPVFVLYSQEGREYALWIALSLWMSASFLRAVRLATFGAWAQYTISLALGLYTYPVTILVALGHGIYVLCLGGLDSKRRIRSFSTSALAAIVLYSPWLLVLYRRHEQIAVSLSPSGKLALTTITQGHAAFFAVRRFLAMPRLDFLDFEPVRTGVIQGFGAAIVLALILFSLFRLYSGTERRIWAFVASLMFAVSIPLLLVNATLPEGSSVPRYYLALDIAILLAVTGCIALGIESAKTGSQVVRWQVSYGTIVAICLFSCVSSARAETWWNKMNDNSQSVARAISSSQRPILVSDNRIDYELVLSNYLAGDTTVLLRPTCWLCIRKPASISADALTEINRFQTIYLFGPSRELKRSVAEIVTRRPSVECVDVGEFQCGGSLWLFPIGW